MQPTEDGGERWFHLLHFIFIISPFVSAFQSKEEPERRIVTDLVLPLKLQ